MPPSVALDVLKAAYRAQTAIDYRHRAGNLELIIQSYERLDA
jgi:hypothetical protein